MRILIVLAFLTTAITAGRLTAQSSLELLSKEVLQHPHVNHLFSKSNEIVVVANEVVNNANCDADQLKTHKPVILASKEDLFMRGLRSEQVAEFLSVSFSGSHIAAVTLRVGGGKLDLQYELTDEGWKLVG